MYLSPNDANSRHTNKACTQNQDANVGGIEQRYKTQNRHYNQLEK
jgi:hypothetical protein